MLMQLVLVSCLIIVFTYGRNQVELCEWNYYVESRGSRMLQHAKSKQKYL